MTLQIVHSTTSEMERVYPNVDSLQKMQWNDYFWYHSE